jgi:putative ABC transport system ATP-binding protein
MVTHDERVAATADRVVSLRDGTVADDTPLDSGSGGGSGGTTGLGAMLTWED